MPNVYEVHTPDEVLVCHGYRDSEGQQIDPDEYGLIYETVVARTPGQARAIVRNDYDLDISDRLSTHKIASDIDLPIGSITPLDADRTYLFILGCIHDKSEVDEYYEILGWNNNLDYTDWVPTNLTWLEKATTNG